MTEDRVALVIGNGAYSNLSLLRNPVRDASALAALFGKMLGFELIDGRPLLDASRKEMDEALTAFCRRLRKGSIGLFYFAGHGLQLGGANYLCPIEAGAAREMQIERDLINAGKLLSEMEKGGGALNILLLDCCRSDPFQGRSFRSPAGLVPMQASAGTILSYATQPGNVALDGHDGNSPFVKALLDVLPRPRVEVLQAFNAVGNTVRELTEGKQVPWMSSSPLPELWGFNGLPESFTPPPPPPPLLPPDDRKSPSKPTRLAGSKGWWDVEDVEHHTKDADFDINFTAADFATNFVPGGADLQAAIDQADAGSRLNLGRGRHVGNLTLTRDVTLTAESTGDEVEIEGEIEIGGRCVVRLENLIIRPKTPTTAVYIHSGGRVDLSRCSIDHTGEGDSLGVHVRGEGSEAQFQDCKIVAFTGVAATEGGAVTLRETKLYGRRRSASGTGIFVSSGATVTVQQKSDVANFGMGLLVLSGGQATLEDTTILSCDFGVKATQLPSRAHLEGCIVKDCRMGVHSSDRASLTVIDSDIEAENAAYADGGSLTLQKCKRIQGSGNVGDGVCALNDGSAIVTGCRIFEFKFGLTAVDTATIEATDTEIFATPNYCVIAKEGGRINLVRCDLHDGGLAGVYSVHGQSQISIQETSIHDCRGPGVDLWDDAIVEMKGSLIFRNDDVGVRASDRSRVTADGCNIVVNKADGVQLWGNSHAILTKSTIRQNGGIVRLCMQSSADIQNCVLSGAYYPSIVLEGNLASLKEGGNLLTPAPRRQADRSSGSAQNSIREYQHVWAERGELFDAIDNEVKRLDLGAWAREVSTSQSGGTVNFTFTHTIQTVTKVQIRGLFGVKKFAPNQEPFAVINYYIRLELEVSSAHSFSGLGYFYLKVTEEEKADENYQVRNQFGEDFRFPSNIWEHQRGANLLKEILRKFTPAQKS